MATKLQMIEAAAQRDQNITEVVNLISAAIKREQSFYNENKSTQNPQVLIMVNKAAGRVDALQSVLEAMRGDKFCLKNLAGIL